MHVECDVRSVYKNADWTVKREGVKKHLKNSKNMLNYIIFYKESRKNKSNFEKKNFHWGGQCNQCRENRYEYIMIYRLLIISYAELKMY